MTYPKALTVIAIVALSYVAGAIVLSEAYKFRYDAGRQSYLSAFRKREAARDHSFQTALDRRTEVRTRIINEPEDKNDPWRDLASDPYRGLPSGPPESDARYVDADRELNQVAKQISEERERDTSAYLATSPSEINRLLINGGFAMVAIATAIVLFRSLKSVLKE